MWFDNLAVPHGRAKKLHCPWTGPYQILARLSDAVYCIQHIRLCRKRVVVYFDRIKPCSPTTRQPEEEGQQAHTSNLPSSPPPIGTTLESLYLREQTQRFLSSLLDTLRGISHLLDHKPHLILLQCLIQRKPLQLLIYIVTLAENAYNQHDFIQWLNTEFGTNFSKRGCCVTGIYLFHQLCNHSSSYVITHCTRGIYYIVSRRSRMFCACDYKRVLQFICVCAISVTVSLSIFPHAPCSCKCIRLHWLARLQK